MRVLLVSIGTELLSDILDTNASLAARRFQECHIPLLGKVTLADDVDSINETLRFGLKTADVVITVGGLGQDANDVTNEGVACATGRGYLPKRRFPVDGVLPLGGPEVGRQGFLLEAENGTLICLPGKPRDMAYLLETEVLPLLQRRLSADAAHGWSLLRTAGLMESTLGQQLSYLNFSEGQQVSFSSFAGQTDIGLWVEDKTQALVDQRLRALEAEVLEKLGDQVYGRAGDSLQDVLVRQLQENGMSCAIGECFTHGALAQIFASKSDPDPAVQLAPSKTNDELSGYLEISPLTVDSDLTGWCRKAADRLRKKTGADLGLVVYNNFTPGGVQILVTLVSGTGVSVMQRSFGGHPDNIDLWAGTLAMVHIRRWLLAHTSGEIA